MLKEILSISGKPGLYKMISQAKNMIIVESIVDGKRIPAYTKDKVISLGDIAIYTQNKEIPLSQLLESIKNKENGALCPISATADNQTLKQYMEQVLPDYDRERVYPSDMRKIYGWYNLLINSGLVDFVEKEGPEDKDLPSQSEETN